MKPDILIIGLGDLGGVLLELLSREQGIGKITAASRDLIRGVSRCNLARLGAIAQGYDPVIEFHEVDLDNKESTAELISKIRPDVIVNTATRQTWWLPDALPERNAAIIKSAGFGMWLPIHLTLQIKLMQALKEADYGGFTITAPYPDVTNCILGKMGLAPTCGVGNIEEIVSKIRYQTSTHLNTPLDSIEVLLVSHHALQPFVFGNKTGEMPPFYLKIRLEGRDITEELNTGELLTGGYPISNGRKIHFLTGGCAVSVIKSLALEKGRILHTPAPEGLPGGYPVVISREGVRIAKVDGITLAEMIEINERSHKFDGIDRIEDDGTTVFSESASQIFKNEMGYNCDRLKPEESEEMANELIMRFKEYAAKLGTTFSLN